MTLTHLILNNNAHTMADLVVGTWDGESGIDEGNTLAAFDEKGMRRLNRQLLEITELEETLRTGLHTAARGVKRT